MTLITCQPLGNLRARCLQNRRQLPAGAPLRIPHYRLQPLGYAIGSVPFRLFAQSNQPLIGARTQMNHSGKHGTPPTGSLPSFYSNVPLLMRVVPIDRLCTRATVRSTVALFGVSAP